VRAVALGLALLSLCLAGSCRRAAAPARGDVRPVHRRILNGKVKGFDPAQVGDAFSGEMALQFYEPLYEFHYLKRNPFALVPLTAAAMPTVSPDGLTVTIPIRPGVTFHDDPCFPGGRGRELQAADFIYSWKRVADPEVGKSLWGFLQGQIAGLDAWREAVETDEEGARQRPVAGLQAPDDHTLVITLTKPNPRLPMLLAMPWSAAVPREAVAYYGKDGFLARAVGTGAYRLEEFVRDSSITRRALSRRRRAGARGVRRRRRPGAAGRRRQARPAVRPRRGEHRGGGSAALTSIPKDAFGQAVASGKLTEELKAKGVWLERAPLLDLTYTCFNMRHPILGTNRKLRQAMAAAIDRKHSRELFQNGRGILAQSPLPPGLFGYDDTWVNPHQTHDVERAKRLLAEAGFPEGKGLPVFTFDLQSTSSTARQGAELFQSQLAAVGIRLKVEGNTWPSFLKKVEEGRTEIWVRPQRRPRRRQRGAVPKRRVRRPLRADQRRPRHTGTPAAHSPHGGDRLRGGALDLRPAPRVVGTAPAVVQELQVPRHRRRLLQIHPHRTAEVEDYAPRPWSAEAMSWSARLRTGVPSFTSTRWQATWWGVPPGASTSRNSGSSTVQRSSASGQRPAKRHPGYSLSGLGTSPSSTICWRLASTTGSGMGTALSSARV
jgi:ABC-type transport system substrate-binding protein